MRGPANLAQLFLMIATSIFGSASSSAMDERIATYMLIHKSNERSTARFQLIYSDCAYERRTSLSHELSVCSE
ncbi:hypothetical protein BDV29DRAFT_173583 [Aspergillus leporis]|uniref:Secreted protein n=1 Tax=Aspergillus leporis TaxID=41062 RepID=A0A5N5X4L7_9EURO|nr:hypothetical protein BDV29DRAFT_173583 [Aspergillus leporis]